MAGVDFTRTLRVGARPLGGSKAIATDWGSKMTYRNALALAAMAAAVFAPGSRTVTVVPRSSVLSIASVPPCSSTGRLTSGRRSYCILTLT
jgi:hypothetical protein